MSTTKEFTEMKDNLLEPPMVEASNSSLYRIKPLSSVVPIFAVLLLASCSSLPLHDPAREQKPRVFEGAVPPESEEVAPNEQEDPSPVRYHRQEDLAAEQLLITARAKIETSNFAVAQAITERAIRIAPDYVHNYITLARIKLKTQEYEEAEQIAEKGLSLIDGNRWFFESQEERALRLIIHRAGYELGQ